MSCETVIKAGTYCPVCRGVVGADCEHSAGDFSVPRTDFKSIDRIESLTKQLDELLAAIENLHKVKGRYHTEQAFQALMATYDRVKGGAA